MTARVLSIETPLGRPLSWAAVGMVTDIGDSHELNDDRCLALTSTQLGTRANASKDFMLCLLADGATGSTFGPRAAAQAGGWHRQAGWRASQLAQGAFVECFLESAEVDILDRLKDGLRAADRALTDSAEGTLSSTLVALYLADDGTAYAASIGDSTLVVLPPRRKTPGDRRLKKLGYEDSTSVGSGDTTLSTIDESECIEQWWPHKEDGGSSTRVAAGTYLVLMSDGISDNLPAELIDQLVHRYPLERAVIGLPGLTRDRRIDAQKRSGASTQQLGLDNMSAIVVRFDGRRGVVGPMPGPYSDDARLVTLVGTHGGPSAADGGQSAMVCVASPETPLLAACARAFLDSEQHADVQERLGAALSQATLARGMGDRPPFAILTVDAHGQRHALSSDGLSLESGGNLPVSIVERTVWPAHETRLQRLARTPAVWGPAIAALAILALVSTAFATGTVRPLPPPIPTPRPGEARPTPDTRPSLSFGGFVLQPPTRPTPAPAGPERSSVADPHTSSVVDGMSQPAVPDDAMGMVGPDEDAVEAMPVDTPEQAPPRCTNVFGIGCSPPPPPVRRLQRAPESPARAVPVPSPAALPDESLDSLAAATTGPPRGSRLESALQGTQAADQNFAREVDLSGR